MAYNWMEVGYYYNKGAGWVQATTDTYYEDGSGLTVDVSKSIIVDGMGASSDFAVNVEAYGGSSSVGFSVSGPSSGNAVDWTEATAPGTASATPSGTAPVPWQAGIL